MRESRPHGARLGGQPNGNRTTKEGSGIDTSPTGPPDGGLDQDALATLAALIGDDDPAFLAELLDDFLAGTPGQLDALGAALDGGDLETARRVAHTLKSTAATFGATELSEACRAVEAASRDGDLDTGRRGYLALRGTYDTAAVALTELRATLPA